MLELTVQEFPGFVVPEEVSAVLTAPGSVWSDQSYHNDAMPKFGNRDLGVLLLVNWPVGHPNREYEFKFQYSLWSVDWIGSEYNMGEDLYTGDSWVHVLEQLTERRVW